MLKFVFLGANGSIQERGNGNTSLLFSNGTSSFLVDVSVNIHAAVEANVDAVVITHEHIDHMYALPSLLHQLWLSKRTKPLTIMCPDGVRSMVNGLIDNFAIRSKKGIFDIVFETAGHNSVGSMELEFFKTVHTPNSVGLVVSEGSCEASKRIVYTCDTAPMENPREVLPQYVFGADVLIHETNSVCNVRKPDHSCGLDAAKLANELGAKRLVICHLPKGDDAKHAILKEACSLYPNAELPEVLKEETV